MRVKNLALLLLCVLAPAMLGADVMDSAANGFTIKIATVIHAGPADIYDRLVHHVGDWWSSDHTFSQDAHNLSIDDKPMGCFCEKMPNNGGVRHAEVIMVMPDKMLVMSGAFGPLQRLGATGTLKLRDRAAAQRDQARSHLCCWRISSRWTEYLGGAGGQSADRTSHAAEELCGNWERQPGCHQEARVVFARAGFGLAAVVACLKGHSSAAPLRSHFYCIVITRRASETVSQPGIAALRLGFLPLRAWADAHA